MSNIGYATLQVIPTMKGAVSNLTQEATAPMEKAGDEAGNKFSKRFGSKTASLIGTGLKAGGAAAGVALVGALLTSVGQKDIAAGMQASMGLSPDVSSKFGAAAGLAYKQNYGESVAAVGDTIKAAFQNGLVAADDSKEAIAGVVAQVETYAQVSGEDAVNSTKAVGQMIKTGIAKNATEAFDILTKGQQLGLNNNEDLIDTFNEYGTQFRKLGLEGPAALGLINQAMKAGARDSDVAADALKEFSIRSIDGSKGTATAFKAIGLDADTMAKKIAAGGPSASAALQLTFDKLKAIKDPAARSAAAVGLFGTQAEDLGDALYAMDPASAAKGLGQVAGATEAANKALGSTPTAQITAFTRGLKQGFVELIGGQVLPALISAGTEMKDRFGPAVSDIAQSVKDAAPGILSIATGLLDKLVPALSATAGIIGSVVGFFAEHATTTKILAGAIGGLVAITAAYNAVAAVQAAGGIVAMIKNLGVVTRLTQAYTAVQAALNLVMSLNPIALVVIAIAALVAGLVIAYKKSETFRAIVDGAFRAVQTAAAFAFNWVKSNWPLLLAIVTGPIGIAVLLIVRNFDTIKNAAGKVLSAITGAFKSVVSFFAGIPGKVSAALGSASTYLIQKGKDFVNGLGKGVTTAAVGFLTWWSNLNSTIRSKVGDAAGALYAKGKDFLGGLGKGVTAGASAVFTYFGELPGKIKSKFGDVSGLLRGAGADLGRGFINGIGDMVGAAASKARELASSAKNAITGFLKIGSPSRVLHQIGVWTGEGLANGMSAMVSTVGRSATALAGAAIPNIGALPIRSASMAATSTSALNRQTDTSGRPVEINVLADDPNATARTVGRHLANLGV